MVRPAEGEATGNRPPENEAQMSKRPNTMIIKLRQRARYRVTYIKISKLIFQTNSKLEFDKTLTQYRINQ